MGTSIREIQAALASSDNKNKSGTNLALPFWQAPVGSSVTVRLLPTAGDAPLPYIEKRTHKLVFDGQVNSERDTTGAVTVTVPCPTQWGERCPIEDGIRAMWRGSEEERRTASRFYRKPVFVWSCLVVGALPFAEQDPPESKVRLLPLNRQIQDAIKSALMSDDFEMAPWDIERGRDLNIRITSQGTFRNYSTTSFSFKERALSGDERAAIDQYGLVNLADHEGEKPSADKVRQLKELFELSLAGYPFDAARFPEWRAYEDRRLGSPGPQASPHVAPPVIGTQTKSILEAVKQRRNAAAA